MRKDARICAFKLIFESFFAVTNDDILQDLKKQEDISFAKEIYEQYKAHRQEICDLLSSNITTYTLDRLNKTDKAILIEALVEILYIKTPVAVAINEAIEIAKTYSEEKSPKFIHGTLSKILSDK